LDTTGYWNSLDSNGYSLPSNGEQEWYINANYAPTASVTPWTVNNGILTLTAAPASSSIQPLIDGYQYTSGMITTDKSFSQTYGYFEERAQLPAGQGLWPAFWLLDENGQWPPEIDAVEQLGNNPSIDYTNVHSNTLSGGDVGQNNPVADTSSGYHTYGVDWEPDYITFYFDGQKIYQTATPADLNQPMYMLTNLAAGGYWPGGVDPSALPAQMNIDWIRAYSSLPSWIADGSDPSDVNHSSAGAVSSGTTGGTGDTGSSGATTTLAATTPVSATTTGNAPSTDTFADVQATYTVADGITAVVLTDTGAQTVTANNLGDTIASNDHGSTLIGGTGNDTLIAGHGADTLTGGAGSDTFAFDVVPWSAGHVTDFTPGTDKIDLSGVLSSYGYAGTNPIGDGWLNLVSDGAGNTQVMVNPHDPSWPWSYLITTLDHVAPTSLANGDFGYGSSASTSDGTTAGTTSSDGTTGNAGSGPVTETAGSYTVAADVTNVTLTGTTAQTINANNLGDTITSNDHASTLIGGTGNDTLIAGHGADTLTGGGGSNTFVFNVTPWSAGHVTDFTPATDKIDLSGVLSSYGYTGTNPIADGWVSLAADGAGNTQVLMNPHDPSWPWSYTITTLDHVSPTQITNSDWVWHH